MKNYVSIRDGLVYESTGLVSKGVYKGLVEVFNERNNEISFFSKSAFKMLFISQD